MKKAFFFLAFFPLFASAQTGLKALFGKAEPNKPVVKKPVVNITEKPEAKGFLIEGKMDGFADGTEILLFKNGENVEMAKTKIAKGKFKLKGSVTEPVLCFLVVGSQKTTEVYVENGVISFKAKKVEPPVYEVEGSKSHKDFDAFVKTFLPLARQASQTASTVNTTMPGPERDKLMDSYNASHAAIQNAIDKFVKDKPKSVVTPFVLNVTYAFNDDIMLLERRFQALDEKVRESEAGKTLAGFIAENKIGAVGTEAIEFSQADTSGAQVALSSFRGKYVLVDFWASWCGPCRAENPNVVENFQKFSNKNFTVLGVSLDRPGQKAKWLEAIKEDNLPWTHVSDLQFWNNAAAVLYNVKSIPQNFLVDPNGKIVAKNLRGPALEAKLCELLGCEPKAKGF